MKNPLTLFLIILSSLAILVASFRTMEAPKDMYVRGEYSKYCYTRGQEHGNIKTKLYYPTLIECGKPLNK